jgi:uracil-DNA glycosylase
MDEEEFFDRFTAPPHLVRFRARAVGARRPGGDRDGARPLRRLAAGGAAFLRPTLVVTVGLAPATALLGIRRLGDAIGKSYLLDDAVAIPLPHPSGASAWLNDPVNRARLGKALTHVRRELARIAPAA